MLPSMLPPHSEKLFFEYLELPRPRSLRALSEITGRSYKYLRKLSSEGKWAAREHAYDASEDRLPEPDKRAGLAAALPVEEGIPVVERARVPLWSEKRLSLEMRKVAQKGLVNLSAALDDGMPLPANQIVSLTSAAATLLRMAEEREPIQAEVKEDYSRLTTEELEELLRLQTKVLEG